MSVLEFRRPPPDEPTTPHLSGRCVCLGCLHQWVGVTPVGKFDGLECPSCHLLKGVHIGIAFPKQMWECGTCKAYLFFMTPAGAQCSLCGVRQSF